MIRGFKSKNIYSPNDGHVQFHNLKSVSNSRKVNKKYAAADNRSHVAEVSHFKRLINNQILNSLSDNDFAHLLPYLELAELPCGELHKAGDAFQFVYFLENAVASHLQVLADGNTTEVAIIGNEGITGLCTIFGSQQPTHWTNTIIGGRALRISADILKQEFDRNPRLRAVLLNYANGHFAQLTQRVACGIYHLAEQRLCSWLLMLQDRVENDSLPLTQDQMASHIGVHRPSITHIAQSLREKEIIGYVRGKITILKRLELERMACECYSLLKETSGNDDAVH